MYSKKDMEKLLKRLLGEEEVKYVDEWQVKESNRKKQKKRQWEHKREENRKKIKMIVAISPEIYDFCFAYKFYLICKNKIGSELLDMRFDEFVMLNIEDMIELGNIEPEDLADFM